MAGQVAHGVEFLPGELPIRREGVRLSKGWW
jgi:hypothetical protein